MVAHLGLLGDSAYDASRRLPLGLFFPMPVLWRSCRGGHHTVVASALCIFALLRMVGAHLSQMQTLGMARHVAFADIGLLLHVRCLCGVAGHIPVPILVALLLAACTLCPYANGFLGASGSLFVDVHALDICDGSRNDAIREGSTWYTLVVVNCSCRPCAVLNADSL